MHVVAKVNDLQSTVDSYLSDDALAYLPFEDLRAIILKQFEDDDRRRGIPYLNPTREVSKNFKIEYIAQVEFLENEGKFSPGELEYDDDFDGVDEEPEYLEYEDDAPEEVEDEGAAPEEVEDVPEEVEDEDDALEDEESNVVTLSPLDFLNSVSTAPIAVEKKPEVVEPPRVKTAPVKKASTSSPKVSKQPPTVVKKKAVKPKPAKKVAVAKKKVEDSRSRSNADVFDDIFDPDPLPIRVPAKKVSAQPAPAPVAAGETYRNVRDLVKHNPNCDISFAAKYFPKSAIQKAISMGSVFLKSGKLMV